MNFQEETLPPTHPPAMWLRSIFDYVVNVHCHKPAQLTATSPHHNTCTPYMAGLDPEKQQLLSSKFCLPCTTPCLRGPPCKPGCGDTRQGSSLTAGAVEGCMVFVHLHVCISSAARGYTHLKDQALPPALGKGRHHPGISPGQQEGASPM